MRLPRINVYRCEHGCNNVTVDVDDGVTPFMMKCVTKSRPDRPLDPILTGSDGECLGMAKSCFYPKVAPPPWISVPTHEWYRPKDLAGLNDGELEHVKKGGLLLRPRTDAEPIYHPEKK